MLCRREQLPVDYGLCCQTVTRYRQASPGDYGRLVLEGVFLDQSRSWRRDAQGSGLSDSFLLVVPGNGQSVLPGDKLVRGVGPEIVSREQWASLLPAGSEDVLVVKYVQRKFWRGVQVHLEAGGYASGRAELRRGVHGR